MIDRTAMIGFLLLTGVASSAWAKGKAPPPPPEIYTKLAACRSVTLEADRLACFDKAAADLDAAVAANELVLVDKGQMKETRKSLFGFSLPKLGLFGGGGGDDDEEEITTLETTIKSAFRSSNGGWGLVLEDGARWVQIDDQDLSKPKPGQSITLRKASMGSYFAKIDGGGRAVRMKRQD